MKDNKIKQKHFKNNKTNIFYSEKKNTLTKNIFIFYKIIRFIRMCETRRSNNMASLEHELLCTLSYSAFRVIIKDTEDLAHQNQILRIFETQLKQYHSLFIILIWHGNRTHTCRHLS